MFLECFIVFLAKKSFNQTNSQRILFSHSIRSPLIQGTIHIDHVQIIVSLLRGILTIRKYCCVE
jgi:hypothetical protein